MAKYKVGDLVIIKSKEWYDENKDGIGEVNGDGAVFVPLMTKYCGKKATIAEVISPSTYRLDIDGQRYNWSEFALQDFVGKYKVGDAVQIKSLEWYNENKSNSGFIGGGEHARLFVPAMSQYCGRTALITDYVPGEKGCYRLSNLDGNKFVWCDYMFAEKAQEEPEEKPLYYKVGETFKLEDHTYIVQVSPNNDCANCAFKHAPLCSKMNCVMSEREDGIGVIFTEVEAIEFEKKIYYEVGEPFNSDGETYVPKEQNGCTGCAFERKLRCTLFQCGSSYRKDGKSVIFVPYEGPVEVEEVEEEQPITDGPTIKTGISIIIDERLRQLTVKGYDNAHDDEHNKGELAHAAALFAYPEISSYVLSEKNWPEGKAFYHPSGDVNTVADRIKELAKAGALITAEIDRLNRLDPSSEYTEQSTRKGFSD